jgi:hypothetical protein
MSIKTMQESAEQSAEQSAERRAESHTHILLLDAAPISDGSSGLRDVLNVVSRDDELVFSTLCYRHALEHGALAHDLLTHCFEPTEDCQHFDSNTIPPRSTFSVSCSRFARLLLVSFREKKETKKEKKERRLLVLAPLDRFLSLSRSARPFFSLRTPARTHTHKSS